MNKFNSCTLALLIGSFFALNAAHAQDKTPTAPTNPMVDALTERGFVALSDGLYSNPSLSSKSLVATNAAGHQALATHMQAEREIFLKRAQLNGITAGEQRVLDRLQSNIEALRKVAVVQKLTDTDRGPCLTPNGASLLASATANSGTSANSTAVNELDFGPITPTDNYAEAATEFTFSSNSAVGGSPAYASASHHLSCYAYGYSYVICPGETTPAVSAFAPNTSNAPRCRF